MTTEGKCKGQAQCNWSRPERHPVVKDFQVRACRACGAVAARQIGAWEVLGPLAAKVELKWQWPEAGPG